VWSSPATTAVTLAQAPSQQKAPPMQSASTVQLVGAHMPVMQEPLVHWSFAVQAAPVPPLATQAVPEQ
jgi:hypothetical protein